MLLRLKRFSSGKQFAAYCGLVPWVHNSNETVRYEKITKRGPEELRTAIIQVVLGMRRLKKRTLNWRLMERYEAMKQSKGSGKPITAADRKVAVIIWRMLSEGKEFDAGLMIDRNLKKKAESMSKTGCLASEALSEGTATQKEKAVSFKNGKIQVKVKSPVLPEKREKKSAKDLFGG